MLSSARRPAGRALLRLLVLIGLSVVAGHARGATASPQRAHLQLEVIVNGVPIGQIGSFVRVNGRIGATGAELVALGLKPGVGKGQDDLVYLDDLPTAEFRYDEPGQRIFITISDAQRIPRVYGAIAGRDLAPTQASYGGVLNYRFLGATGEINAPRPLLFDGASLALDARAFSPVGTLNQSAYFRSDDAQRARGFRLDSTYRYSDQEHLQVYVVGDTISGGLPWTRPIRIGGIQTQSNFSLRPDLITAPLPSFSGTAAVPSTVDVYIGNIKTFSQDVEAGPFSLVNVPMIPGVGSASVIVRDATGHETRTSVPFYSSPNLLAPSLTSFSLEAGFPRLAYGTGTDTYLGSPVATATLRRGAYDWLTLEGHVEAGRELINAGGGFAAAMPFGTLSGAVSASQFAGDFGGQAYFAFATGIFGASVQGSTQRTIGNYGDLNSFVARAGGVDPAAALFTAGARPVRSLDRITVAGPVPFYSNASISGSVLFLEDGAGTRSQILAASWSQALPLDASVFATAFLDFGERRDAGVFVGLATQLFDSVSTYTSVSSGKSGTSVTVEAAKPQGSEIGSVGWRITDSEGQAAYQEAAVAYRSPVAQIQAAVRHGSNGLRGTLGIDGAVAVMGGGVFLANPIDDSFAVVRVGAPGVPVEYENRRVGVTDAMGMLLVPSLRSFDRNQITIDPSNLPVDADIAATRTIVAPADRSGVLVDFGVRTATASALVVFTRSDGSPIPVGSSGKTESGEEFIVGYDGQAFLKKLAPQNVAAINTRDGSCRAEFAYAPQANEQVRISPIICRKMRADGRPMLRGSLR